MRAALLLLLSAALGGCAARAASGPAPAVAPARDALVELGRDLDSLFGQPSIAHAQWGVAIHSLATGAPVYTLNNARLLVPASSQKVLTTAVAGERLGWDFRFTTRLWTTAPLTSDGVLQGDLVVVSDGDPSINPRHPDRWRVFDDWAIALKAAGITRIEGRLIGDDNAFAEPALGAGWAWDDLVHGYGAPPTGLQYHENQVEVIIGPGVPGSPAIIATSPAGSGLVIDNRVTTAVPGTPTSLGIDRPLGSAHLMVSGQIAADARTSTLLAAADDPTRFYLNEFNSVLARHGIHVASGVMDADRLNAPLEVAGARDLVVDRSPPLPELVDVINKWSRNIYAESLLLRMAPPATPATADAGLSAYGETMSSWGLTRTSFLSRDGSGLSRYDYVSADALVEVLKRMHADERHRAPFTASLPVAGQSGTLATRMIGTPAEGRVRAKTGTMSNVRSIAGYATTMAGDTMAFAILTNGFRVSGAEIEAVMDAALVRLVGFNEVFADFRAAPQISTRSPARATRLPQSTR